MPHSISYISFITDTAAFPYTMLLSISPQAHGCRVESAQQRGCVQNSGGVRQRVRRDGILRVNGVVGLRVGV